MKYLHVKNLKSIFFYVFYSIILWIVALFILGMITSPGEFARAFDSGIAFYILILIFAVCIAIYAIKIDPNGKRANRLFLNLISRFFSSLNDNLQKFEENRLQSFMEQNKKDFLITSKNPITTIRKPDWFYAGFDQYSGKFRYSGIPNEFFELYPSFGYLQMFIYDFSERSKYLYPMEKKIVQNTYLLLIENWQTYLIDFNKKMTTK